MNDMDPWQIAAPACALVGLACAIAFWRTRRQLANSEKERRELEGSLRILEEERHVLELIARGAGLEQVLNALTQAVENIVEGVFCSVLLVSRDGKSLLQGAAPHLPPEFWKMCDGVPIIDNLGCCPTAAFRNETVISEDMGTDFRWASIRDQVLALGLRSCWSVPIRDSETNRVIGTFAMYRNQPSKPTPYHIRAVQAGAQLAGSAMERLRAEQNLRNYAERFVVAERVAAFGIWEWDPQTGAFELSVGAALMIGFGPKSVRVSDEEVYAAVHPDDREPARKALERAMAEGGSYEHEFRRIQPDGSIRWFRNSGTVQLNKCKPVKMIGAIIDITEQKELLFNLERAKSAAEDAGRAKSEFLANMSHEIRTPMNGVVGMTGLALALAENAEQRDYLLLAQSSADSLMLLVNDILDLSRIEAGKLAIEPLPFEPRVLVHDLVRLLEVSARAKDLTLKYDCAEQVPARIIADPLRIRQVLINLAGNALKFTETGTVEIRVVVDETAGLLRFTVRDTGIGIPLEKQSCIFDSFTQADGSITRKYGGSGLGLTISSKLVTLMGGTIHVESRPGEGATFEFTAPYQIPTEVPGQSPPPGSSTERLPAMHILLAEDNVVNQKLAARLLEKEGHSVMVVPNGKEAVDAAAHGPFDLILMDVQMPEMDGLEATRSIRAAERPAGSRVPIVAMTAHAMTGDRERCLQAGMDGYVSKPVKLPELLAEIAEVIRAKTPSGGV